MFHNADVKKAYEDYKDAYRNAEEYGGIEKEARDALSKAESDVATSHERLDRPAVNLDLAQRAAREKAWVEHYKLADKRNELALIHRRARDEMERHFATAQESRRKWMLAARVARRRLALREERKRNLDKARAMASRAAHRRLREERKRNLDKAWAIITLELEERERERAQPLPGYSTPPQQCRCMRIAGNAPPRPASELPQPRLMFPGNAAAVAQLTQTLLTIEAEFAQTVPNSPAEQVDQGGN